MAFCGGFFAATSGLESPSQWLVDWIRGPKSASGVDVTAESALGYPPVWYAINKIAGHVGALPLNIYKKEDSGGKTLASRHPAFPLVTRRPNEYQTAISWKKMMMLHALLHGNGRTAILRDSMGKPVELLPLMPQFTHTCLVNGEKWHIVTASDEERCSWVDGSPGMFRDGKVYRIPDRDCIHILGLSYNGYSGISLLDIAKDPIGLGLAGQNATSQTFKSGAKPGVVIEAPLGMFADDTDAKEFIDSFNEYHSGVDNAGRAAMLREGMKLSTVAMTASEAQWLEQRLAQRVDVAMLFGLETLPGDEDSVSYSSLEQKNLAYLQNCLTPWLTSWEQECDWKLLTPAQQERMCFNFDETPLLRTDNLTKAQVISTLIASRVFNPNEGREFFWQKSVSRRG